MRHLRFGAHCFVEGFFRMQISAWRFGFQVYGVGREMDWIGTSQHPVISCPPAAPNLNCHYMTKSILGILCCLQKTGLVVPRGSHVLEARIPQQQSFSCRRCRALALDITLTSFAQPTIPFEEALLRAGRTFCTAGSSDCTQTRIMGTGQWTRQENSKM